MNLENNTTRLYEIEKFICNSCRLRDSENICRWLKLDPSILYNYNIWVGECYYYRKGTYDPMLVRDLNMI